MSDTEANGNVPEPPVEGLPRANSMEELSDYTDADESLSAPTEILAEFLSSVMTKDYQTALKYCTMILTYEPNNSTAKEFYPLILEKLEIIQSEDSDDSSSQSNDSYSVSSLSSTNSFFDNENKSGAGATSGSYSSLLDDDLDIDNAAMGISTVEITEIDSDNGNLPPEEKKKPKEKPDVKPKKGKNPQPTSALSKVLVRSTTTRTITDVAQCPVPGKKPSGEKALQKMTSTATYRLTSSPTMTMPTSTVAKLSPSPTKNTNRAKNVKASPSRKSQQAGTSTSPSGKRRTSN